VDTNARDTPKPPQDGARSLQKVPTTAPESSTTPPRRPRGQRTAQTSFQYTHHGLPTPFEAIKTTPKVTQYASSENPMKQKPSHSLRTPYILHYPPGRPKEIPKEILPLLHLLLRLLPLSLSFHMLCRPSRSHRCWSYVYGQPSGIISMPSVSKSRYSRHARHRWRPRRKPSPAFSSGTCHCTERPGNYAP
jgi:hypothetical protein